MVIAIRATKLTIHRIKNELLLGRRKFDVSMTPVRITIATKAFRAFSAPKLHRSDVRILDASCTRPYQQGECHIKGNELERLAHRLVAFCHSFEGHCSCINETHR